MIERYNFSKGHVFIQGGNWSLFMNGAGNCGRYGNKDQAVRDILNDWKLSEVLKSELSKILNIEIKTSIQLELF